MVSPVGMACRQHSWPPEELKKAEEMCSPEFNPEPWAQWRERISNWVGGLDPYTELHRVAREGPAGMVLESLPNTIIMAPILAPIAHAIGVDPVHFAIIFLVGGSIGFIAPPYGLNLYVASGVTGVPYMSLLKYTVPYLVALIAVWLLVALVPELSTILLPNR